MRNHGQGLGFTACEEPQLGFRVYTVHEELRLLCGMRGSQLPRMGGSGENSKSQNFKNSKIQKLKNSKFQKFKDSKIKVSKFQKL